MTVSGKVTVTPDNTTNCSVYITPPVLSNFTNVNDVTGMIVDSLDNVVCHVSADLTDDEIRFLMIDTVDITQRTYDFTFTYEIK